jgi:hypothetical protein
MVGDGMRGGDDGTSSFICEDERNMERSANKDDLIF